MQLYVARHVTISPYSCADPTSVNGNSHGHACICVHVCLRSCAPLCMCVPMNVWGIYLPLCKLISNIYIYVYLLCPCPLLIRYRDYGDVSACRARFIFLFSISAMRVRQSFTPIHFLQKGPDFVRIAIINGVIIPVGTCTVNH